MMLRPFGVHGYRDDATEGVVAMLLRPRLRMFCPVGAMIPALVFS